MLSDLCLKPHALAVRPEGVTIGHGQAPLALFAFPLLASIAVAAASAQGSGRSFRLAVQADISFPGPPGIYRVDPGGRPFA